MTVFILGYETSSIYPDTTATKLAEHGIFEFRKKLDRRKEHYGKDDILVRYGVATYPIYDKRFGEVFNKALAISHNCNKLESHIRLKEAGVSVPEMWTNKRDIKYPALRRRINHSRGRDIIIMKSPSNFRSGDFYTQFIDSYREYRAHIFNGKCIRLSIKAPSSEGLKKDDKIRSSTRGWTAIDHYEHMPYIERDVVKEATKAVSTLGLDFGCVDVLVEKGTNKPYVLEVNTCPRLSKFGRECYILAIRKALSLSTDEVPLGLVKDWEHKDETNLLYRRAYRSKEERRKNTKGL